jgi:phosphopantothenoylcysteine decarboxylase / phosphopantothenate---cysteine ligase
MWTHPSTQGFYKTLQDRGVTFIGPVHGRLASGAVGQGRMAEPETVVSELRKSCGKWFGDLAQKKIVISAGGCREAIDPVRYITNASSGKQGHALAEAARDRGAEVHLITTNSEQSPQGLGSITAVSSHQEMQHAVTAACQDADVFISAAAVSDFTIDKAEGKITRGNTEPVLTLKPTTDIIASLTSNPKKPLIKVAFAAEVGADESRAIAKMKAKGADIMVLNDISRTDTGFAVSTNQVRIYTSDGGSKVFPESQDAVASKYDVACEILNTITGARNSFR